MTETRPAYGNENTEIESDKKALKDELSDLFLSQLRLEFEGITDVEKAFPHTAKLIYELAGWPPKKCPVCGSLSFLSAIENDNEVIFRCHDCNNILAYDKEENAD